MSFESSSISKTANEAVQNEEKKHMRSMKCVNKLTATSGSKPPRNLQSKQQSKNDQILPGGPGDTPIQGIQTTTFQFQNAKI
jgi:hypothetical protein